MTLTAPAVTVRDPRAAAPRATQPSVGARAGLPTGPWHAGHGRPGGFGAPVGMGGYGGRMQAVQPGRPGTVDPTSAGGRGPVPVLRRVIGDELRRRRNDQGRTLREVSAAARVSLGYLSEVERGQKEASSELLASICTALEVPLSVVLRSVSDEVAMHEAAQVHRSGVAVLTELSVERPGGAVASAA